MSVVEETFDFPTQPSPRERYLRWKGLLDRCSAAAMLAPGLPAILVLGAIIRLTSRGPAIYSQNRVGKDGKVFTMYKLRSMRIDAEDVTGAVWATEHDPRVTWVGRILRRTHLDELPQLFNVLFGQMALVGPRPERPEIVPTLANSITGYRRRLNVLPGVTGLAQINLPPDTDLESVRRKQTLDLHYIQTMNLSFDIRLVLCTALRTVGIRWQLAAKMLGVYCKVELSETVTERAVQSDESDSATRDRQQDEDEDVYDETKNTSQWEDEGFRNQPARHELTVVCPLPREPNPRHGTTQRIHRRCRRLLPSLSF